MNRTIAGFVLVFFACSAESQIPNAIEKPPSEFEVASVRVAKADPGKTLTTEMRGGPGTGDPRRVTIEGYAMFLLLMEAYNVPFSQLAGLTNTPERYTITAVLPEGATKEQFRQMLQNLLMERFKLKVHRETREMPIFRLSVVKHGPLLRPHSDNAITPEPAGKDSYPMPEAGGWAMYPGPNNTALYRFNLVSLSVTEFSQKLAARFNRPIVDSTGIEGKYDFVLSCWVDTVLPQLTSGDAGAIPVPPSGPEYVRQQVMGAIQKEFGLKFDSAKGPVEFLVVDHYEKTPTEN